MKKGFLIFSILFVVFMTWYLFIKESDYTINFKSATFPETINQSLKLWDKGLENAVRLEELDDFKHLKQTITASDSLHTYLWNIESLTDSTSQVSVGVTDKNFWNSVFNRLEVPFTKTNFSLGSEKIVLDFMTALKDHVDNFKITIIGLETIPEKNLAYVPIKKAQIEKAKGMMENSTFIGEILTKNGIELDGPPMIEITEWNREKDSIAYNFGYPILPNQNVPLNTEIQYKKLESKTGIKAIYNGNYITSDRAWYALLNYAKNNDLEVEPRPIEVFYNNPDLGGNALDWKTEVFLPLSEKIQK